MKNILKAMMIIVLLTVQFNLSAAKYTYDAKNQLTKIELDSGSYVMYSYDAVGNIEEIKAVEANPAPPSIKTQPKAVSAVSGQKVAFAVVAEGSGLRYQWRKGGVDIVDATKSSFTIEAVVAADAGDYDVIVSNDYGTITSNLANLAVAAAGGILKIAVSNPTAGTTVPPAGSSNETELGNPINIVASANPGYSFTKWSIEGNALINDEFDPNTAITLKANATATANFADNGSVSTLTVLSEPPDGGTTNPSAPATLKNGQEYTLRAIPADGFYFIEWSAAPTITSPKFNQFASTTVVAITQDTTLTANFARKSPVGQNVKDAMKATIKMDNPAIAGMPAPNKNSIKVSNMPLGAQFPTENFTTGKFASLTVDGEIFKFDSGVWSGKKDTWTFKTDKGTTPKITMTINLKNKRNPLLSLDVSALTLTQINNGDGVDIYVLYDGNSYGANFAMDEKSSWKFDSTKNDSVPITGTLNPMPEFGIGKSDGKSDTVKKTKNGLLQDNDSWKVSKGNASCPFDPEKDTVIVSADSFSKAIPPGSLANKKGNVYSYESKADGLKILLDFDKNSWSLSISRNDCAGIRAADGIDVFLNIGNLESGQRIYPAHKTTLSYPKK